MKRTLITLFLILAPVAALACGGSARDPSNYCTGIVGLQNVFSGIMCEFQTILNEVLTRVYCGMQEALRTPLAALIIIYVIVFGLQFTMGYVRLTVSEAFMRVMKIALVWTFAMDSSWGIGFVFNFFVGAATEGIGWMLMVIMPAGSGGSGYTTSAAFAVVDRLIYDSITGPFTEQGAKLAGIIAVMSFSMPPLFMMFVYFTTKSMSIFTRAALSYALGISAIGFLIALMPIFLCLALFQTTFKFFDDWLRFLISFTLQIILIFGALAMWIGVTATLGKFFIQLANIVVPVQDILAAAPVRAPVDSWGLCSYTMVMTGLGPMPMCNGRNIVFPSQIVMETQFIYFVAINMISLCLVAYAFDKIIDQMPNLARQLAGPSYVPQLGGGAGLGAVKYPGLGLASKAGQGVGGVFDKFKQPKA